MLNRDQAIIKMDEMGTRGVPFLFFTDFEMQHVYLNPLDQIPAQEVSYDFNGKTNSFSKPSPLVITKEPIRIESFDLAYQKVIGEIKYGNSFLTNLTFETKVSLEANLVEIFQSAKAKYKLRFKEDFVCFSPEAFVKIENNEIRAFPMKGTIDANVPDAENVLLSDPKEKAEHVTIVDLIRNDLSAVSSSVRVERFRYLDMIRASNGNLLQVSSEIVGDLSEDWKDQLGHLLFSLLPAGSICGAPKPKTIDIIKSAERHTRGFYTGVCGLFDGESLDSGVMIRYIEKRSNQFYYKSGGGITAFSELEKEYQEYKDKIYIPGG